MSSVEQYVYIASRSPLRIFVECLDQRIAISVYDEIRSNAESTQLRCNGPGVVLRVWQRTEARVAAIPDDKRMSG